MNYRDFAFLLVAFAFAPVLAAPQLAVPPEGVSFGEISAGETAARTIEVRNASDSPVSVSLVRACCGAEASLSPMRIEPSASATLSVSVKQTIAGEFTKDVHIFCDDPECPIVLVPVSGVVLAPADDGEAEPVSCEHAVRIAVLAVLCAGAALLFRQGLRARSPAFCIGAVLRLGLCAVFLYAGAVKLCDVASFAQLVSRYDILPDSVAGAVAVVLPAAECAAGVLLVFSKWVRASAAAVTAMLVVFIVALVQAAVRGLDVSCGCFGGTTSASDGIWPAVARDAVLLASSSAVLLLERFRRADG